MNWSSRLLSVRSRIRSDAVTTRRSLASLLAPSGSTCRCRLLTVAASSLSAPLVVDVPSGPCWPRMPDNLEGSVALSAVPAQTIQTKDPYPLPSPPKPYAYPY